MVQMIYIIGAGFVLGAFLGSFIDCIAYRSIKGESFWGRSYCEDCKHKLAWYELIPILSYLLSYGRCRHCKTKLSIEFLLIEVLMGLLTAFVFFQNVPLNILSLTSTSLSLVISNLFFNILVVSVLITIFITDIKSGLIPDRITYPSILIAFFYLLIDALYKIFLLFQSLNSNALGKYLLPPTSDYFYRHAYYIASPFLMGLLSAVILGLFFFGLIVLTRGRGMGGGDFKLSIFLGLVFGLEQSLVVLMLAFSFGALFGIGLILMGKKKLGQTIPFGPFLSLGGLLSLFWGEKILNLYLNSKLF